MRLSEQQVEDYRKEGYLLLPQGLSDPEVAAVREHADADLGTDSERRVLEADGRLVRGVHGSHLVSPFFRDLVRLPRLLEPARRLLGGDVYVHQFKINMKAALGGERWEWHQDSFFWQREDGMPTSRAVNVAVHVDESTEFNGPLLLIPGSHRNGEIAAVDRSGPAGAGAEGWRRTVSASLKYQLSPESLSELVTRNGIVSVTGRPGSVLLFHPALVHGSSGNMTPFARRLLIISYNSTANRLREVEHPRPDFIAHRDPTPLVPLASDELPLSALGVRAG